MSFGVGWPPEWALAAAVAGMLLIYGELNRPGRVAPGCAGLLLLLLGVDRLLRMPHHGWAMGVVVAGLGLLVLPLWVRRGGGLLTAAGTVLLTAGLVAWPNPRTGRAWGMAAGLSGLVLGPATGWLAGLGGLARPSKRSHAGATASGVPERWE